MADRVPRRLKSARKSKKKGKMPVQEPITDEFAIREVTLVTSNPAEPDVSSCGSSILY
jgi:hypothetical protein